MRAFFSQLLEYNFQSNEKLIEVFLNHSNQVSEKSQQLFSHILNAHHIWNSRIQGEEAPFAVWDIHPIDDFPQLNLTSYQRSTHILQYADLDQSINYTNSKGLHFDNSIRDTLFHLINHSTYHRGQIASDFRKTGIEPVSTDYIFFKRS
ncbi:DinB family protein [Algoriphagus sp.]|uniref:DinB family protein n=1 Tax=Algoriphagus sp. TaxID=1872435 RepID=UPI0026235850|nr:DinB family protein [Algoriphagus sp.]